MVGVTGISVPIKFFDGERETNIGDIFLYPDLDFKKFQTILSRKIGIPPQQFSVFISSLESRKRFPMNGKVNFWAISRNKDCIFVVVPKRSKRDRRRKNQSNQILQENLLYSSPPEENSPRSFKNNPSKNFRLLKRDMLMDYDEYVQEQSFSGYMLPSTEWIGNGNRAIDYQLEKMRYMVNVGGTGPAPTPMMPIPVGEVVCKDCLRARAFGIEAEFHLCVNDAVTFGFRSSAGPIARPIQFKVPSSTIGDLWSWGVFTFSASLVLIGGGSFLQQTTQR